MVGSGCELQEEGSPVYWSEDIEARCMGSTRWVHLQFEQQHSEDIADGRQTL